jgi:mono/diheme cytochrome c family protein
MSRRILASLALIALTVLLAPAVPAAAQVDEGKAIFEENCVPCHGEDLSGGVGKPLNAGRGQDRRRTHIDHHQWCAWHRDAHMGRQALV